MTMDSRSVVDALVPKSGFVRSIVYLLGGSLGAHALVFLVTPIITRIYSPSELGAFALIAGFIAVPALVAGLRYELAIPIPEKNADALILVCLSGALIFCTCLLALLVIVTCMALDLQLSWPLPLQDHIWLVPIGIGLAGLLNVVTNYAVRQKSYRNIAASQVKQSSVSVLVQLVGFSLGTLALLISQFANQITGVYSLSRILRIRLMRGKVRARDIKKMAVRYSAFPVHGTAASLMNVVSHYLPAFILSFAYSPASAGLYALVYRTLAVPASMLSSAVGKVVMSQLPEEARVGNSDRFMLNACRLLLNVSLAPIIWVAILAPDIFGALFGADWSDAGRMAQWLLLSILFSVNVSPVSTVLYVVEKQHLNTLLQSLLFAARFLALVLGTEYGDPQAAVALYSVASAIVYGLYQLVILHLSGIDFSRYLRTALVAFGFACITLSPLLTVKMYGVGSNLSYACAALSLVLISVRLVWVVRAIGN